MRRFDIACVFALALPNLFYFAAVAAAPAFKPAAEAPWYAAQFFLCVLLVISLLLNWSKMFKSEALVIGGTLSLIVALHIYVAVLVGPMKLFSYRETDFMTGATMALLLQTIAIFLLPIANRTLKLRS